MFVGVAQSAGAPPTCSRAEIPYGTNGPTSKIYMNSADLALPVPVPQIMSDSYVWEGRTVGNFPIHKSIVEGKVALHRLPIG